MSSIRFDRARSCLISDGMRFLIELINLKLIELIEPRTSSKNCESSIRFDLVRLENQFRLVRTRVWNNGWPCWRTGFYEHRTCEIRCRKGILFTARQSQHCGISPVCPVRVIFWNTNVRCPEVPKSNTGQANSPLGDSTTIFIWCLLQLSFPSIFMVTTEFLWSKQKKERLE